MVLRLSEGLGVTLRAVMRALALASLAERP
ncbi:hypothetical protein RA210_U470007 [Rubrivivax sp. A210]|nr:hypothetical protein RA210_U470007 [Rubrivivax sp. A210]